MSETDPVQYFQSETKRLNYYNSQFLKEEDFRDEQLYHSQMRRFHNRSLHTWGVVAGLEVSQVAGAKQVAVAPGTAIDRLGREIVLSREMTLPQQGGLTQDAVSFDGFDAGSQVYLTINYGEATDQADRDAQGNNYTRTVERPKLALSASAPADGESGVVLATITLDKDKSIAQVGTESRRYAGSRIGSSSDGKEFSVFADPTGAWHFYDGAKGADRLSIDGDGKVGIGTTPTAARLSVYSDAGNYKGSLADFVVGGCYKLGLRFKSPARDTVAYHLDLVNNLGRFDSFLVLDRGNVGIGTTSPLGPLSVGDSSVAGSDGYLVIGKSGIAGGSRHFRIGLDDKFNFTVGDYGYNNTAAAWSPQFAIAWNAPSTSFYISGDGSVGIGTAQPNAQHKLEVAGLLAVGGSTLGDATKSGDMFRIEAAPKQTDSAVIRFDQDALRFWTPSAGDVLRINKNGNIGIGTTKPLALLQVGKEGSDGSPSIRIGWGANNDEDRLAIYHSDGYNMGLRRGTRDLKIFAKSPDGDGHIHLMPNNAVAMSLLSSGNVGVGTSDAPCRLTIRGGQTLKPLPGQFNSVGDGNPMLYTPPGTVVSGLSPGDWVVLGDREKKQVESVANSGVTLKSPGYGPPGVTTTLYLVRPADIFRADDLNGETKFLINGGGNVGVGTNNPTQAKLEVRGSINNDVGKYRFVASDQIGTFTMTAPYSIYAERRVAAEEFNAFSDERIKLIEGRSDAARDLATLMGIEITDYRYKDVIGEGNDTRKKVVGQQVEKVFPQAISKHTDVVPDIYRQAAMRDGWAALATDLKRGERVKLITEKGEEGVYEVLEVAHDKFRVDFRHEAEKVFVFGREVNDFLTVDYDAIAMLNVSATQQIKKETDEEVKRLRSEIAELRAANDVLSSRLELLESGARAAPALVAKTPNGNGRH